MANYEMNFKTFGELVTFIRKKKCPNCNSVNLTRHFHKEFIGMKKGKHENNLGYENYYKSTAVYKCTDCGRSYTIKGLMTGENLESDNELLTEGESKESIKIREREVNSINKKKAGKFFCVIITFMVVMIIHEALSSGNITLLFIFGPVMLLFALTVILIFKLTK